MGINPVNRTTVRLLYGVSTMSRLLVVWLSLLSCCSALHQLHGIGQMTEKLLHIRSSLALQSFETGLCLVV